jgi:hypothetical protein
VPRVFPLIAFVGAPLLLASDIAIFFGAYDNVSPLAGLAALPVAAFEFGLGLWLVVRGFNPESPLFLADPSSPSRGSSFDVPAPRQATPATPVAPSV